ncbi:MAG: ribonuclease E/G [Holosporaceae bacterium]|jgi:ribonuclease E|nr:ribonuclease E/G [Holosporaceae bacterium]
MSKIMLIDSAHTEEIRVAVVDGYRLDKFDFETPSKAQVRGNIYLSKIVRVEPSLQAAFVDYGGERHGFLSFSEIHHDYFQIPVGDRQDLENHIQNAISSLLSETGESGEELDPKEISKLRYQFYRRYKIQEVIKKRQIMLVQVTKEERGNKGAALTTYISLAGRYCVLMPNTAKGSGVSKKVANHVDRQKLKKIVSGFNIENGSTVIRTAGIGHSKSEIVKDFNYLKNMWDEIRETTIKSTAPCLIHEEASIIKRAIRDLYSRDIESIFIEGEEGYKTAKSFVKKLMPSYAKNVKLYNDAKLPLFSKFKINDQINQIYSTRVNLPSGGYLIINTTEAMVSIDVNSGKATRERNISETALKTNLEAAVEIARQCRLRDLAGLIVVDFIDMLEKRNNTQVERCLRDSLREDKAKIQVGVISNFGLLEFSRQRMRSSIADANMIICPHCNGTGFVWSNESVAIQVLRKIEETIAFMNCSEITTTLSLDVATYLMNHKRGFITNIEERTGSKIIFKIDSSIPVSDFRIEQTMQQLASDDDELPSNASEKTSTIKTDEQKVDENTDNDEIELSTSTQENKEESEIIAEKIEETDESADVISLPVKNDNDEPSKRNNRNRRRRRHSNAESSPITETIAEESNSLEKKGKEPSSADEFSVIDNAAIMDVKIAENKKWLETVLNVPIKQSENRTTTNPKKNAWWRKVTKKQE